MDAMASAAPCPQILKELGALSRSFDCEAGSPLERRSTIRESRLLTRCKKYAMCCSASLMLVAVIMIGLVVLAPLAFANQADSDVGDVADQSALPPAPVPPPLHLPGQNVAARVIRAGLHLLGFGSRSPKRGFKVCVVGGAGGIGQPLSLMLTMNPFVSELAIIDLNVAPVPAQGVVADLSHIEGKVKLTALELRLGVDRAVDVAGDALSGCDLVLNTAGVPRKPGQDRSELFNTNADIAKGTVEAVAKYCPDAVVALIVNPVNSVVPAMTELWKKAGLNPKKIVGVTTLDVVRANRFVEDMTGRLANIPVIGGHAGKTILPVFSQDAAGRKIHPNKLVDLDTRVQNAGTEVVMAKNGKGSSTLSMAYAAARLAKAVLSGLAGVPVTECAFVESSVVPGFSYFASKVVFGKHGVQKVLPIGKLNAHEKDRLKELTPILQGEINDGLKYAETHELAQSNVVDPHES